jgi:nitrogen fixation/metabolism regulation signal transduction histidine kinase
MKRLVNEFRDYARLPAAELKPVDLNALVQRRAAALCTTAKRRPRRPRAACRCRPNSTRTAPLILGDAQQLRQVIHNLLQNAQDATEGKERRARGLTALQWTSSSACA